MNSITAAKNRRTNPPPPPPTPQTKPGYSASQNQNQNQNQKNMPTGLTLPQVIQLVDMRLVNLEKFMNEVKTNPVATLGISTEVQPVQQQQQPQQQQPSVLENTDVFPEELKTIYEEFDKRYEMLAEEIIHLKNIVLNLQSYTMDVNKLLMEERLGYIKQITEEEEEDTTQIDKSEKSAEEETEEPIKTIRFADPIEE